MKIIYLILFLSVCKANAGDDEDKDLLSTGAKAFCTYTNKRLLEDGLSNKNLLAEGVCNCLSAILTQKNALCRKYDKNHFIYIPNCTNLLNSATYTKLTGSEAVVTFIKRLLTVKLDVLSGDVDKIPTKIEDNFKTMLSLIKEQLATSVVFSKEEAGLINDCFYDVIKKPDYIAMVRFIDRNCRDDPEYCD